MKSDSNHKAVISISLIMAVLNLLVGLIIPIISAIGNKCSSMEENESIEK